MGPSCPRATTITEEDETHPRDRRLRPGDRLEPAEEEEVTQEMKAMAKMAIQEDQQTALGEVVDEGKGTVLEDTMRTGRT